MEIALRELNKKRKVKYQKNPKGEDFLHEMNRLLHDREATLYKDYEIKYPFIFIFGLPRSGTTLISQLITSSFDIGYINNLMARFWLAPVHGIRLSKSILGDIKQTSFHSDYAGTSNISDIHEFGYFWRYWLKKESLSDITNVKERENNIDWNGLKKTLANIQKEFNKPIVFKNIFGSYHLEKLKKTLHKVLYVYIERDILDVAVSILDARKKFYSDLNTWWSYTPVEYNKIKDLNYWEQIAGQIYYLKRFYRNEIKRFNHKDIIEVSYKNLCFNPKKVLKSIQKKCVESYNYELNILNKPTKKFPFRTYANRDNEKAKFKLLLEKFKNRNN